MSHIIMVIDVSRPLEIVRELHRAGEFEILTLDSPLLASSEPEGDILLGCFAAGALAKPGTEPKFNLIFPRGTWHGPNFARMGGSFTIDDAFLSEVVDNWKASGKPRIPVRWGHEHMKSGATPELKRALDRKAGNVIDLRITAAGLEGLTEWNPEGAADVSNGTFDGWSAEWWPKHVNRLTGETRGWYLSGVALTNEPYFELLPPIAAAAVTLPPVAAPEAPAAESTDPNPNQEHDMSFARIAAVLGLSATATEDAIVASAEQLKKQPATDNTALTAAIKAQDEKFTALTAAVAKKDEQLSALTAALLERDVDALIATAKRGDGKTGRAITDPLVLVAKNIAKADGLKASETFLQALPLTVPLQATSQQGNAGEPLTASTANAKISARAEELRKAGDPTPTLTAMRELPNETLIAENRRPTSQN